MPVFEGYEITHNKDGSISFLCRPTESGTYRILVEHEGIALSGLPMSCVVQRTEDGFVTAYKTGDAAAEPDYPTEGAAQGEVHQIYHEEAVDQPVQDTTTQILNVIETGEEDEAVKSEEPWPTQMVEEMDTGVTADSEPLPPETTDTAATVPQEPDPGVNVDEAEQMACVVHSEDIKDVVMAEEQPPALILASAITDNVDQGDDADADNSVPIQVIQIKEEYERCPSPPLITMSPRRRSSRSITTPIKFEDFVAQMRPAKVPEKRYLSSIVVDEESVVTAALPTEEEESLPTEMAEQPEEKPVPRFPCPVEGCDKVLSTKQRMTKHAQTHEDNTFICGVVNCKKHFKVKETFLEHCQRQHNVTGEEWLSVYPCTVKSCTQVLEDIPSMRTHLETDHKDLKNRTCEICPKVLGSVAKLKEHMETHCSELKFECDEEGCKQRFRTKRVMMAHKSAHKGKSLCFDCGKQFASQGNLNKHIYAVHTNPRARKVPQGGLQTPDLSSAEVVSLNCDMCQKHFRTKNSLKIHIKEMHVMEQLKVIEEDQLLPYRPFKCIHCGKGFKRQAVLKAHLAIHESTTDHHCTQPGCHKKFSTAFKLKDHMRCVHRKEDEVHYCTIPGCNKKFKRVSSLNVHMRKHSDERFACHYPGCERTFSTKFCMLSHYQIQHESSEPRHFCSVCNRGFRLKLQLRRHMDSHNETKSHACPTCGKCFKTRGSMLSHSRIHSADKQYVCKFCSKSFPRKYRLTQHINTTHTTYLPQEITSDMHMLENASGKHILIIEQVDLSDGTEISQGLL